MKKFVIRGGRKLSGNVRLCGAKNAVLPILAASLLASEGESVIDNVPRLHDVQTMEHLLSALGAKLICNKETITVSAHQLTPTEPTHEWASKMRASILVLAPLLARTGLARIALPGGCPIGSRPIDLHLKALEEMGATIFHRQGVIEAHVNGRLQGADILLDVASVGATEQIMLAAVLAEGTTYIRNAACEPEIVDLAAYLGRMGADIQGAGSNVICIKGIRQLRGTNHTVIPDRMEAGTYIIAGAITGGDVIIEGAPVEHLGSVIDTLRQMGIVIEEQASGIRIRADRRLQTVHIKTLPYPGFPTDLQAPITALMTASVGRGIINETLFENRFQHVQQLRKFGAHIDVQGRTAVVYGGEKLHGAHAYATDLRAGAALVCAALRAEGVSYISGVEHIERGYADFVSKLSQLGADIMEIEESLSQQIIESAAALNL